MFAVIDWPDSTLPLQAPQARLGNRRVASGLAQRGFENVSSILDAELVPAGLDGDAMRHDVELKCVLIC